MVSNEIRLHWDGKYQRGLPSLEKPDPFFLSAFRQFVAPRFPNGGIAFDLAGGIGRHALWLAKRNWHVTVVDISTVAIDKLRQKAGKLDLTLNLAAMDATEYRFAPSQFDLIVMFYHFDRDIVAMMLSALKTSGFVICKSSVVSGIYEGTAAHNLRPLEKGEIVRRLPGIRALHNEERVVCDRGVVEYVGQKC